MANDSPLTVLVIPDSHAEPDQDLSRFTLLGRMICDVAAKSPGPFVVVNIGDMFDMKSLNSFDRPGSHALEGRRYRDDIAAGIEAQRLIWKEVEDYNRFRRGSKVLEIEWHYTLGNHEARISRCVASDPKFEGVISLDDITDGSPIPWEVHDFLAPVFIGGVAFSHYFASGVMGRSVGGENAAATMLRKQMTSCIQGHTHTLDFAERSAPTPDGKGRKLSAAVVGCYFTHFEEWAGPQVNALWTPGIAVLHDVHAGGFDFEWWSYARVLDRFGE